jgi:hypothetical protein
MKIQTAVWRLNTAHAKIFGVGASPWHAVARRRRLVPSLAMAIGVGAWNLVLLHWASAQGSLTPPGPPAPSMKSLNQVRSTGIAVSASLTPGDSGNQFIITAPGSYFLTGNVNGVSGKNGIKISSPNVSIDLNGFTLEGASGSSAGITDGGASYVNVAIKNGAVDGWSGAGIDISHCYNSVVSGLIVTYNGGVGMNLGDACVLRDCVARNNHGDNIATTYNATITHCSAY